MRLRAAQLLLAALSLLSLSRGQSLAGAYRAATTPQILSVAVVENVDLSLDGVHLHLNDGFLGWASPVEGQPTALVFRGHGHFDIALTNALERRQFQIFSKQAEPGFYLQAAVFRFADRTRLQQAIGNQAHFFFPAPRGAPELEHLLAARLDATAKSGGATAARLLDGLTGGAADLLLAQLQTAGGDWLHLDVDPLDPQPLRVYTTATINLPLGDLPWYKFKTLERLQDTWTQFSPSGVAPTPPPWTITQYQFALAVAKKPQFHAQETLTLKSTTAHRGILLTLNGKYRVTAASTLGQPLEFVQARDPSFMFADDYAGDWLYLQWPRPVHVGESLSLTLTIVNEHAGQQYSTALRDWVWPDQAWYPVIPSAGAASRVRFDASVNVEGKLKPWLVLQAHSGTHPGFDEPMASFGLLSTLPPAKSSPSPQRRAVAVHGATPALLGHNYLKVMSQVLADAMAYYRGQFGALPLQQLDLALGPSYFQNSRVTGRDLRRQTSISQTLSGLMQAPNLSLILDHVDQLQPDNLVTVGNAEEINKFALASPPQTAAGGAGPRSIFGAGAAPPGFDAPTPLQQAQLPPPIAGEIPGEKNNLPRAQPEPSPMSGLLQRDAPSWPGLAVINPSWARLGLLGYPSMVHIPYGVLWPTQVQLFDFTPAHVVARQWWGDWVGADSRSDQWVLEALASGSAMMFVQYEFGDPTAADLRKTWLQELTRSDSFFHVPNDMGPLALGPRLASSLDPAAYDVLAEDKGGYILEMLRSMMGEARFRAAMLDLTGHYGGRNLSAAAFEQTMAAHMSPAMDLDHNHGLAWFFDEYVNRRAIDALRVSWRETRTAGRAAAVELTVDNPGGWRGLLPFYLFQTKEQTQRALIPITSARVQVRILVPFHPQHIAADPWHEMLVKIADNEQ